MKEHLEDLMRIPYITEVVPDSCTDGSLCYVASHPELPGCRGQGRTPEEAEEDLKEARRLYLEALLERGLSIPPPSYSSTSTGVTGRMLASKTTWRVVFSQQSGKRELRWTTEERAQKKRARQTEAETVSS